MFMTKEEIRRRMQKVRDLNRLRAKEDRRRKLKMGLMKRKKRCKVTKARVFKAMELSGGLLTVIAERLNCHVATLYHALKRPDWGDVHEALEREVNRVGDIAETAIQEAIKQRVDLGLATLNARWLLTRARYKHRKMGDESKVVVDAISRSPADVPVEELKLPLDVRRKLLKAIDEYERQRQENDDSSSEEDAT